jgi:hypothetical protein
LTDGRRVGAVHRVGFYAVLFDGFLSPTLADYPLMDHIEYRVRRAWPKGVTRRYVGEVRLRGVADLAFEELLHLLESGPTVIEQLHVVGYSAGTVNAVLFCERLLELPTRSPRQPGSYRLHPGFLPRFLGRHETVESSARRVRPLTSLAILDCNAQSRAGLGVVGEKAPVVELPIQRVLHLRSVRGPRRGLLDGRGLPMEFANAAERTDVYFGGHHGLFPLEGGRPALSVDDEAVMGESAEEVRAGEGRLLRASEAVFEFVAETVKKATRPVLASGGVRLR